MAVASFATLLPPTRWLVCCIDRLNPPTVAAFVANARTWADAGANADERAQARAQIAQDLPALRALGLFEVLEIRDERLRALVDGL